MTEFEEVLGHLRAARGELDKADALCTSGFCKKHAGLVICINIVLNDLDGVIRGAEEGSE